MNSNWQPMTEQPKRLENGWHFPWATFYDNGIVHTWDDDGTGGENWNANEHPDENKFEQAIERTPHSRAPVSAPIQANDLTEEQLARMGYGWYEQPYVAGGEICGGDGMLPHEDFEQKHGKEAWTQWGWLTTFAETSDA